MFLIKCVFIISLIQPLKIYDCHPWTESDKWKKHFKSIKDNVVTKTLPKFDFKVKLNSPYQICIGPLIKETEARSSNIRSRMNWSFERALEYWFMQKLGYLLNKCYVYFFSWLQLDLLPDGSKFWEGVYCSQRKTSVTKLQKCSLVNSIFNLKINLCTT